MRGERLAPDYWAEEDLVQTFCRHCTGNTFDLGITKFLGEHFQLEDENENESEPRIDKASVFQAFIYQRKLAQPYGDEIIEGNKGNNLKSQRMGYRI